MLHIICCLLTPQLVQLPVPHLRLLDQIPVVEVVQQRLHFHHYLFALVAVAALPQQAAV